MKRRTVFVVGLILLFLSFSESNGQFQTSRTMAAQRNLFAYESKAAKFNTLIKKEIKRNRLAIRKRRLNYSGRWTGKLYQPDGPLRSKFNFVMRLSQKGKKVSGFSRIAIIGAPQYYGVMKLKGAIRKNRLSFTEVKVTQENLEPDSRWCIKSGKLRLTF